jgi:hypothetical protein
VLQVQLLHLLHLVLLHLLHGDSLTLLMSTSLAKELMQQSSFAFGSLPYGSKDAYCKKQKGK